MSACLVEKNPLVREGIKSLLVKANYTPLTELSSIEELEERKTDNEDQLIIIGVEYLSNIILESIMAIKQKSPNVYIVVMSEAASRETIFSGFSAGVDGFLLKDISTKAFLASLSLVIAGEKVFPTLLASVIKSSGDTWPEQTDSPNKPTQEFSPREYDVIELLVDGKSNKLIANLLNISEATVKVHLKTILRKLKFSNRTQIAIWAFKNRSLKDQEISGSVHTEQEIDVMRKSLTAEIQNFF